MYDLFPRTVVVSIRIDEATALLLDLAAEREGLTRSATAAQYLSDCLVARPTREGEHEGSPYMGLSPRPMTEAERHALEAMPARNASSPKRKRAVVPSTAAGIANGADEVVDVQVAAARLNTSVTHVRHLIRTGKLAHVRVGRFIRVPVSALTRFLADG